MGLVTLFEIERKALAKGELDEMEWRASADFDDGKAVVSSLEGWLKDGEIDHIKSWMEDERKKNNSTLICLVCDGILIESGEFGESVDDEDEDDGGRVSVTGMTVVISGDFKELTGLSQSEVKDTLSKAGATVGSSVTKKTDLLIQGDGIGSKNQKAKELGIPVVEWKSLQLV